VKNEHAISDKVFQKSLSEFLQGRTWVAYNASAYYPGEADVFFFASRKEAEGFVARSPGGRYKIIYANSIAELFNQLPYGKEVASRLIIINQSLKTNFMNLENINYLKENLKYNGFGENLYADLEKHIQQGLPEFVLKMQHEFNGQKMDAILFFRKSEQSENYFFNKYDAVLRNDAGTFEQSFYLNKGQGVTLKEAFNLLQGRAVYKEMTSRAGEKYKAWIELDFKQKENGSYKIKQYHHNYGYDLEATLKSFPIRELQNDQQKEALLLSLQKGNRQSVTMTVDGRDQLFFVQANPQFKTLSIYDKGAVRPLSFEQKNELMVPNSEERTKLNGEVVKTADDLPEKEIKSKDAEKGETKENKDMPEKTPTKTGEEKTKAEKKTEAVKELLPKTQNPNGKGLRA